MVTVYGVAKIDMNQSYNHCSKRKQMDNTILLLEIGVDWLDETYIILVTSVRCDRVTPAGTHIPFTAWVLVGVTVG